MSRNATPFFTLLLALLVGGPLIAQELYDDFDDRRVVDYGFINGAYFEYMPNPGPDAVNSSPNCAEYFRNPFELFDVIVTNPGTMMDISDYISGTKTMTMDVYAPEAGATVQITLEDSVTALPTNFPTGRRAEFTAVTTTSNAWETLTFTLIGEPDPTVPNTGVNRAVILFKPNTNTDQLWYFDNWNMPERVASFCDPAVDEPLTYWDGECEQDLAINLRQGVLLRKPNPDPSGINTSDYALRYDRAVGEMDAVILGEFPAALTAMTGSSMSFDVYDVNAPSVFVLAIENGTGGTIITLSDSTAPTEVNTWTTMNFDLSGMAGVAEATNFVLLYKPGGFFVGRTFIDNWTQFNPVGLNQPESAGPIALMPNPATNLVNVALPALTGEAQIEVFDATGRTMMAPLNLTSGATGNVQLDANNWPNGTYLVRLVSGQRVTTERLLIAR